MRSQADQIINGDRSNETIEAFSRYSSEMKNYLLKTIKYQEVIDLLDELPDINYSRNEVKLWQYLIFPIWWLSIYKDYHAKNKTIREINLARGKYATLEFLIKGMAD